MAYNKYGEFVFDRKPKQSNVYLAYEPDMDLFKIGYSKYHPNERMKALKRKGFKNIRLIVFSYTNTSLEKKLHTIFKEDNILIEGQTEFFKLEESQVLLVYSYIKNSEVKNG